MKRSFTKFGRIIECTFAKYKVIIKLQNALVNNACRIAIYSVKVCGGTKVTSILAEAKNVQAALEIPFFEVFKEGVNLFLAISYDLPQEVALLDLLEDCEEYTVNMRLPFALGRDLRFRSVFTDLSATPHILYGGSTNSGKSVGLQALVLSLALTRPVEKVNFIIFDIGANSLSCFEGLPHLSCPIVKDSETGVYVVKALAAEMERRIRLNMDEISKLPAIVCVLDEFTSFLNNMNKTQTSECISALNNLLQRGRKANISMVLAAQNPTQDNIRSVDIANITARIAFKCAKFENSITILGVSGAENLAGKGDMLFKSPRVF